jgi:hypothetical protein
LFTKELVLAVDGGIVGALLAQTGVQLFAVILGDSIPRLGRRVAGPNVLMFTAATVFVTCILFSMSPAVHLANAELVGQLKVANRSIAPSPVV